MIYDALVAFALAYMIGTAIYLAIRLYVTRDRSGKASGTALDALQTLQRSLDELSGRVDGLHLQVTQQRLTILDTAEKVANRLQDRERKRRERAEVGDPDEIEDDATLLALARQKYPLPQMPLPFPDRRDS